ncbi:MAG: hypothetical protein L0H93_20010 [Nocardioides sp.]|nr:hypothetical protein [Nocardioides sp.]
MTVGHAVEFFEDPRAFLDVAADSLAVDPVVSSVVSTVSARWARSHDAGEVPEVNHPLWWAAVHDSARQVVGTAMGTAPFAPYPPFVLPMPGAAARELAAGITNQLGPVPKGVNGALQPARIIAEELAEAQSGRVLVHEHLRLFEIEHIEWPQRPAGFLRLARPDEAELALSWFQAFNADADAQAGRVPEPGQGEHFTTEDMAERIYGGRLWFWVGEDDTPVHLTGANVTTYGVNRIGPVYTPPERRGHGYASRAVAEVSGIFLDQGVRVCLFTDQANPVSNGIYQAIGYRRVVDMVNLRIE